MAPNPQQLKRENAAKTAAAAQKAKNETRLDNSKNQVAEARDAKAAGLTKAEYETMQEAGFTGAQINKDSYAAYTTDQFSAGMTGQAVNFSNVNTASGRDARTIISDVLKAYGLQGLTGWAWNIITSGGGADEITDTIQQQPLFKAQFPGIALREKMGLPPISMADYISLEDTYDQLVSQYGLPRSVLTKDFVGELIGNDVSASEMQDRITKGYAAVEQAPAAVQQAFSQWFGAKGNGQLAAYFLNPKNASDVLEQEALQANVQGAGTNAGVDIGRNRAAQLAAMGDSYAQVQSALNKLTTTSGLYQSNQAEGFSNTPIPGVRGQAADLTASNQGVGAALGISAEDEQEVEQRGLERQNAFRGGGGAAQQATQGYAGLGTAKPF